MAAVCFDGVEREDGFEENRDCDRSASRINWRIGEGDSSMEEEDDEELEEERINMSGNFLVPSTSLQSMLSSILEERSRCGGTTRKPVSEGLLLFKWLYTDSYMARPRKTSHYYRTSHPIIHPPTLVLNDTHLGPLNSYSVSSDP